MTTRPRRRWFRYSLRSMFVVVTVAAAVTWMVKGPAVRVIGQLRSTDVRRVCAAVEADNRFKGKRINRIEVRSPTCVEILVEEESESTNRSIGHSVRANKIDSAWVLDNIATFWSETKLDIRHE